jgi:hypothetical protein
MKNVFEVNGVKYRKCKVCLQDKLFTTEFFQSKNGKRDGGYWLRTECRDCVKKMNSNKRKAMKNAPRKMPDNCECCGRPRGNKSLCCDHIHGSSKFRGWICQPCNKGIGMTIDDPDIGHKKILIYYKKNDPEMFEKIVQDTLEVINKEVI